MEVTLETWETAVEEAAASEGEDAVAASRAAASLGM